MKKTKIICSIGPASCKYQTLKEMVLSGMNVARINFSHANEEEIESAVNIIKQINEELGTHVAVLYDTKGPDFRTGLVADGKIELVDGKTIKIVKELVLGTQEQITVNYPEMIDNFEVGTVILLEDGLMKLKVNAKGEGFVECKIITGGILGNRKGINVPGVKLNISFISEQDEKDIEYACKHDADFLALSFVSSKDNLLQVRELLKKFGKEDLPLISKIETNAAIKNIAEIIENSDGIMVARGDLGVEVPMEQLPILQKMIISKCCEQGKVCIVATEMLASMYLNSRPTRAEVSDIANAVLDGTDAVMLSGETTIGKYPVESVKYMAKICENAENYIDHVKIPKPIHEVDITGVIAENVLRCSELLSVKVIIAATLSGYTPKRISTHKPNAIILAACHDGKIARSLALRYGIYCTILPYYENTDEIIEKAVQAAKRIFRLEKGDLVVVAGGLLKTRITNFLKIETI